MFWKNRTLMILGFLVIIVLITGCDMVMTGNSASEDQELQEEDINMSRAATDTKIGEWRCYDQYGGNGNYFWIRMYKRADNSKYLSTSIGIDLMNIPASSWNNRIRSIVQLRVVGDYPEVYISSRTGMIGPHGTVMKLVANVNDVPFTVASIVPVVPAYSQTKYTGINMLANMSMHPVGWKVNSGSGNAVIPNGFSFDGVPECEFTFSYIDVNNTYFYLKSEYNNNYVCADLANGSNGPLYANRTVASWWELFKITSLRKDSNGREWIRISSAGSTGSPESVSNTVSPIASYGPTEEFMLYRF